MEAESRVTKELAVSPIYDFRPYKEEDVPFIQNSWGSSYYKGAQYHQFLSPDDFHHYHRPIRERLLMSKGIAIIVACDGKDEDLILGWIMVEKPWSSGAGYIDQQAHKGPGQILHYLYVKQAFKGEKLASELIKRALPARPVMMTHMTDRAAKLIRFNPAKYREFYEAPHLI